MSKECSSLGGHCPGDAHEVGSRLGRNALTGKPPVAQGGMQRSGSCRARAMQAVGCGVRGAAGDVAQAQLRSSCCPLRVRTALQRSHTIQHFLEQSIPTHLSIPQQCSHLAQGTPANFTHHSSLSVMILVEVVVTRTEEAYTGSKPRVSPCWRSVAVWYWRAFLGIIITHYCSLSDPLHRKTKLHVRAARGRTNKRQHLTARRPSYSSSS